MEPYTKLRTLLTSNAVIKTNHIIAPYAATNAQWYNFDSGWCHVFWNNLLIIPSIIKTISGALKDVQKGLKSVVEHIHNFANRNKTSDTIKLLVPQQYVAKLIGVGKITLVE